MQITADKLRDLFVRPGHIGQADFETALKESQKTQIPIERILVEKGLITDEQLGTTIADGFDYHFIDLKKEKIDEEILNLIPELVARSRGVIAISRVKDGIKVGMRNPKDIEAKHFVEKRLGENIEPYYITQGGLESALLQYKTGLREEFQKTLTKLHDPALPREERDEMMVRMIDTLLQYGYDNKASDIHVEPYREKIVVRFRVDGVMHDVLDMPLELSDLILTRIKILSKMRTDEHRAAQDGKFQFDAKEENVDVRVSVVPVTGGENIVMRLLSAKSRKFDLVSLGLSGADLKKVEYAIERPHGMILVTGPTGSGKTTTIYAMMKILNKREVNISTIEDPVEYDIEGISQIQVNTQTNLTFAKGLRAIVRQDPDIIMVGEIRDEETAGIAVNSAMTGHLVLSTLHANDAATTLPRLLDMGIEPFLVASTVNIIIAQRLVRKICEKCRASHEILNPKFETLNKSKNSKSKTQNDTADDLELKAYVLPPELEDKMFGDKKSIRVFKGAGCKVCGDTGYSGRIGVFEVLEMTQNIKDLIIKRASSDEIMKAARANGMTTMLEDGVGKAFQGITTIDEVFRVTKM